MELPKTVFVKLEEPDQDGDVFLNASEDPNLVGEYLGDVEVGVYQLKKTVILHNRTEVTGLKK